MTRERLHIAGMAALLALAVAVAMAAMLPATARAQGSGEEIELEEDPAEQEMPLDPLGGELEPGADVPEGATENPGDLLEFGARRRRGRDGSVRGPGYPRELVFRPLTLYAGMAELALEVPLHPAPFKLTSALEARYGVARRVELGLGYGALAVTGGELYPGKAVAVEARYRITDWLAAQAAVPLLLDPFAMGMALGAPMRFRFGERFALVTGQDLVSFQVARFLPVVADPQHTQDELVEPAAKNTVLPRGELRLVGGAIYQIRPDLALTGEFGVVAVDFALSRSAVPLIAGLTYTPVAWLDLGARIGFANLERTESFGLTLCMALRI